MSLNIGGIDIADSVINTEYRIGILERIINKLVATAPPGTLSGEELERFRQEALQELQAKYPEAGINPRG